MIRKATPEDAADIAYVQITSWRTTYQGIIDNEYLNGMDIAERTLWLEQVLTSGQLTASVYTSGENKLSGFASGGKNREESEYAGELYAIYLLKEAQRKGAGKMLFQTVVNQLLEEEITSMMVWVLQDNPSKHFYIAMGGKWIEEKETEIGGQKLIEEAYGWPDIRLVRTA